MTPLIVMDALESATPASRMARDSEADDREQKRRQRKQQNAAGDNDPDFYNDEAPHELDELA